MHAIVKIVKIDPDQTLKIRNSVLRPGKDLSDCIYAGDLESTTGHFGAFLEGEMVGVVSIYARNSKAFDIDQGFQIRAMATIETARGLGIANLLLKEAEEFTLATGAKYIWANARVSALGFYQKAGYELFSEEFDIEGVGPHRMIVKNDLR